MKTKIAYGTGIGLAIFALTLICYVTGLHDKYLAVGIYTAYLAYGIGFAGLWLGIRETKRKHGASSFTYGRAFGSGAIVTLFWGLTAALGSFVYLACINTDFADQMLRLETEKMEGKGMSSQQIEATSKFLRIILQPLPSAISTFISYVFIGLIFSLIIAAFLKSSAEKPAAS